MRLKSSLVAATVVAAALAAPLGCSRDPGPLQPWPLPTDPIVFQDNFTGAVDVQAFGNSKVDALSTDTAEQFAGTGCIRVNVPGPGAGYAGGAFTTGEVRDLTGYNALTFYAKASKAVTIDVAGLGNDNTGTSKYEAVRKAIPVTTAWAKQVIPIPDASRLTAEGGLFFFAAAPQGGPGYVLWFDEVKFENLDTISNPQPTMRSEILDTYVGASFSVKDTKSTFDLAGSGSLLVEHMPAYFRYASSNPSVATVDGGLITVVGAGTDTISAWLDSTAVAGTVVLNTAEFEAGLAPTPTLPASSVISLFSDAYPNVGVDRWSADWDVADVTDLSIFGNHMKYYTNLLYAGIEFTSNPINATAMTHFHMDVYSPFGSTVRIKLVDFGSDGAYGGFDSALDTERELTFTPSTTPAYVAGSWVALEIPLSAFMDPYAGLAARAHLAQLVVSGDVGTLYVDNVYFHK
ncbi:MAG TPA: glycosyl hydrolase family 16 [Candidatus Eisenbacteria bacterium]